MMKKIFLTTLCAGALLLPVGCNNFLDIYPEDRLMQEQVTTSEASVNSALNGIYMQMANPSLYGEVLTMDMIECLGQQYNVDATNSYSAYANYLYGDVTVSGMFSTIWLGMYSQILAINIFMDMADKSEAVPAGHKNILLGEAYALRAFHHFDLLRLFGPVYNAPDSATLAFMPYNESMTAELSALLPPNRIMDKILADLNRAEILLANDPIITDGIVKTKSSDPVANFQLNRHYRMNYYAVKALQARVWLWRGNKEQALAAAKAVVDADLVKNQQLFGWMSKDDILRANDPDRIFSPEVIFGIRNAYMYDVYNARFAPTLAINTELCALGLRTDGLYNANDLRRISWVSGSKSYRTCNKYIEPEDLDAAESTFAYFQPLIRKSELYYIIAECETAEAAGRDSLNRVRFARGLELVPLDNLAQEIENEYRREFYAEGQLFYYYKRLGAAAIPAGNNMGTQTMSNTQYMVPMPQNEQQFRPIE